MDNTDIKPPEFDADSYVPSDEDIKLFNRLERDVRLIEIKQLPGLMRVVTLAHPILGTLLAILGIIAIFQHKFLLVSIFLGLHLAFMHLIGWYESTGEKVKETINSPILAAAFLSLHYFNLELQQLPLYVVLTPFVVIAAVWWFVPTYVDRKRWQKKVREGHGVFRIAINGVRLSPEEIEEMNKKIDEKIDND